MTVLQNIIDVPFFSIILPTYNREKYIRRAVLSIIHQDFKDWELIIIDDGSTDTTFEKIKDLILNYHNIIYHYQENSERCISRNYGVKLSKSNWICFLDSDDYHLPNHLTEFYKKIISNPEPSFYFTNAYNESNSGLRTARNCPPFKLESAYSYFLKYTVNPQRWCVHKSIIKKHPFDPNITICEDLDTSLRILTENIKAEQIPICTTVYVATPDSFTHGDPNKSQKELFYLKKIFSKIILKNKLPKLEQRRLLSMCYFHLSQNKNTTSRRILAYSLASFCYYPKGYNGKNNKILLSTISKNLGWFGKLINWILIK
jgi:glycosyltransferase involved in cell wall biosynthesis